MNDEELLERDDLWNFTKGELVRRGWLLTKQEAKTESQQDYCDFMLSKEWYEHLRNEDETNPSNG